MSILLVVEKGKPCMSIVHIAGGGHGYTPHVHAAGGGNGYTQHMMLVLLPIYDAEKSQVTAWGNARKWQSGISISTISQLPQSCIGIPASGSVRFCWSQIGPALPGYENSLYIC
jgi:hypothetical protein